MRNFAVIAILSLSIGCASSVAFVVPSHPDNVASLKFEKPSDEVAYPFAHGIYRIDSGAYLLPPYADQVFLAPGKHRIGVNCTRGITTGEQPSISYRFAAGMAYVLTCEEGEPRIVPGMAR